jgi:hypothetical protein
MRVDFLVEEEPFASCGAFAASASFEEALAASASSAEALAASSVDLEDLLVEEWAVTAADSHREDEEHCQERPVAGTWQIAGETGQEVGTSVEGLVEGVVEVVGVRGVLERLHEEDTSAAAAAAASTCVPCPSLTAPFHRSAAEEEE